MPQWTTKDALSPDPQLEDGDRLLSSSEWRWLRGLSTMQLLSNLISYLTGPLQQPAAAAAANVSTWAGAGWMFSLLGAFVADLYLGRYWTILFSFLLYILGLGMLTLSATLRSLRPPDCDIKTLSTSSCPSLTRFQVVFFFLSLYAAALALGGLKPCAQAFRADQFDPRDPKESKSKSSFFNWCTTQWARPIFHHR
ncbi:hypothetical protein AAC387_Pa01g3833 [Persea americana]